MDSDPRGLSPRVWLRYMLDTVICHVDTCICLLLQAIANVALFYQISSQLEKVEHSAVFSDVRNFVHTQILLSPSCSRYPIYPKYKFSSQSEKVKNSAVYSDGRNFAHIQILLSPSFSGYLIYPKYKISSQSDKVEISRIQWISCENENRRIFLLLPLYSEYPIYPINKISS